MIEPGRPANPELVQERLIHLRSQDFLARTGDRRSIVRLLESIGDPDPKVSQYSLDKVFANPLAYRELMDPASLVRVQVIQAYSENDPERAVRFSIDSLAQDDADLRLLALDVLDCNIAYLEPSLELHLKKMLHDVSERVRVKAGRLLVLLSNYVEIDLSDTPAIEILESALDSPDLYCRQTAYGMPASIFYKIKNVKSTIDELRNTLTQRETQLGRLREENAGLRSMARSREQQESGYAMLLENIEEANRLLREQMDKYEQAVREREETLQRERRAKEQLLASLIRERKARAAEVEHARSLYESLVQDFQQREEKFKHQVYDFYTRFGDMFRVLIEEKEELLDELYRQEDY
ncbi:MAG: hypothetical protein CVV27_05560 [Candidatus Melainabacteria bacterium HGW-Melainabacteria-1]|nr:MAG: hypothetical protein CVV27_05560 [Candidatus Melainabacteria bacterium HGW-Melainabacteria-1]